MHVCMCVYIHIYIYIYIWALGVSLLFCNESLDFNFLDGTGRIFHCSTFFTGVNSNQEREEKERAASSPWSRPWQSTKHQLFGEENPRLGVPLLSVTLRGLSESNEVFLHFPFWSLPFAAIVLIETTAKSIKLSKNHIC